MADPSPEERAEKLWTPIPESERHFFPIRSGVCVPAFARLANKLSARAKEAPRGS